MAVFVWFNVAGGSSPRTIYTGNVNVEVFYPITTTTAVAESILLNHQAARANIRGQTDKGRKGPVPTAPDKFEEDKPK